MRLIDVRSHREVSTGVIEGAEIMPLHLVPLKVHDLREAAKEHTLVFYCHSGSRSAQACAYLAQQGIDATASLQRGVIGWVADGNRLQTADVAWQAA
jgi:rhodanese-related sulfurtransferase